MWPMTPNWISKMTDQIATCFQVNCISPIRVPIEEETDHTNGQTIKRLQVRRKMAAYTSPVISNVTNIAGG